MCVCLSVSDGSGDVRGAGLDYSDARPSYFNLSTELREECWRTLGWNPAGAASGCGEQQSKLTQSGSSS